MSIELPQTGFLGALSGDSPPLVVGPSADPRLAKLVERTEQLFPGGVRIAAEEDPEIAGESYLVFHVRGRGDVRDVPDLVQEWHDVSFALLPDGCDKLRISVDMRLRAARSVERTSTQPARGIKRR